MVKLFNPVLCATGSASKNSCMAPVKTCPLDPADLVARCRRAASAAGFREESFGLVDGVSLIGFTKRTPGPRPRIYLSAGVHGDEPAPPLALLKMLENGLFDDRANWFLVPMVNPTGFRENRRENTAGIDLNRDYLSLRSSEVQAHVRWLERQPRFDLALCLHEDWEACGFYLYELLRGAPDPTRARELRDAATHHLPVQTGREIDGRPISETGIIRPESDPALRDQWPEAIYLFAHHTDICYTLETPTSLPLDKRCACMTAAVEASLATR